ILFAAGAGAFADAIDDLVLGADGVHLVDVPAHAAAIHQVLRIAPAAGADAALAVDARREFALGAREDDSRPAIQLELLADGQRAEHGHERTAHVEIVVQTHRHESPAAGDVDIRAQRRLERTVLHEADLG